MENNFSKDELQIIKRDLLRDLAYDDFASFCEYCFVDTKNPTLPFIELKDFQREWCELVMHHSRLNLFSPYEHGKTSILTIAYPIWRLGRDTNNCIIIICSTYDRAVTYLAAIKDHISDNKYIKEIFPNLRPVMDKIYRNRPAKWSEDAIRVARSATHTDYSIQAIGVGSSSLLGSHVALIIMDDVVTLQNSANVRNRQAIIEWYDSTADKRLTLGSQCINVCTAWYANDLPHYLETRKGWVTVKYSVEPEDKKLGYRLARWPEKFPPERLKSIKEHNEREYNRSLRNVAKTADAYPFAGKVEGAMGSITLDDTYKILIGFDLATRKRKGTALAVIAYSNVHPKKALLDIEYGAWTPKQKKGKLVFYTDKYNPDKILVEDNALQDDLAQEYKELKGSNGKSLPIYGVTTGSNKALWMETLEEEFDENLWILSCPPSGHLTRLREELEYYPDYETSDGLMALVLANSAIGSRRGKGIRVSVVRDGRIPSQQESSMRYDFMDYQPYNRILQRSGRDVLMPDNYLTIVKWVQKNQHFMEIDFAKRPAEIDNEDYSIVLQEMISYVKALNSV